MFKVTFAGLFAFASARQVEHLLRDGPQQLQQTKGFMTYKPVSANAAYCFKQNGMNSAIIQSYAGGAPSAAAEGSLNAIMGGGMMYRDAWFTPDITGTSEMVSPQDQLKAAFVDLEGMGGAWNGRLWIQIMGEDDWTGDTSLNQLIYQNLIQTCD